MVGTGLGAIPPPSTAPLARAPGPSVPPPPAGSRHPAARRPPPLDATAEPSGRPVRRLGRAEWRCPARTGPHVLAGHPARPPPALISPGPLRPSAVPRPAPPRAGLAPAPP